MMPRKEKLELLLTKSGREKKVVRTVSYWKKKVANGGTESSIR